MLAVSQGVSRTFQDKKKTGQSNGPSRDLVRLIVERNSHPVFIRVSTSKLQSM